MAVLTKNGKIFIKNGRVFTKLFLVNVEMAPLKKKNFFEAKVIFSKTALSSQGNTVLVQKTLIRAESL